MSNIIPFRDKLKSPNKCPNCGKCLVGLGHVTCEATQCAGMCIEMAALAAMTTDTKPAGAA